MHAQKNPGHAANRIVWSVLLICAAFAAVVFGVSRWMLRAPGERGAPISVPSTIVVPDLTPASPDTDAERTEVEPGPSTIVATNEDADGTPVSGLVRARGGEPIRGATVRIHCVTGPTSTFVGEVGSGSEGRYEFRSRAITAALGTDAQLVVAVHATGFRPARQELSLLHFQSPASVALDVRLETGEEVRGRVVDSAGQPVTGALVALSVSRTEGRVETFVPVESQTTGSDGRFTLGFTSSGRYHVLARAEGIGTAFRGELDLVAGTETLLDDLALRGGAPIAGRVTVPGGAPVPFLELWAIDGTYALQTEGLALAVSRAPHDEREDGLSVTRTFTDGDGRFALAGLRPAHYALRCPDRALVLDPHQLRYEPGFAKVELFVHSQRLIVKVVDAVGRPARGASVRLSSWIEHIDGTHGIADTRTQSTRGADSLASFVVEPESPVVVQAFDAQRAGDEEVVILAQNEWSREMTLVLPSPADQGRILFDLVDESGRRIERWRVSLASPVTNSVREDIGILEGDSEGRLPPVPAGSYHYVIGFTQATDRYLLPIRSLDPVQVTVGGTTTLALRARSGGRVTVTLRLTGTPPAEELDREGFGARILLTSGSTSRALQFRGEGDAGLIGSLLPGETLTADDLLEPGEYALQLKATSVKLVAPVAVVVEPGATHAVTVDVSVP